MNFKRITAVLLFLIILSSILTSCGLSNKNSSDTSNESNTDAFNTPVNDDKDAVNTTPSGDVRLSFLAAGDNIIHECVYLDAISRANVAASSGSYTGGKYYFKEMYGGVSKLISDADISFVNQEAPIAGDNFGISGYPNFNAPVSAGDTLVELGFDVVNIANNHMLDMEHKGTGYKNSIDYWKTKDVLMIGGYENNADYNTLRIIERQGVKIAFLSYVYGTNTAKQNSASACVVPLINDSIIMEQVDRAKKNSDIVIVSMHWGNENTFTVTEEQKRLAQLLANRGVDAVIGHHSHTIQPMEWLEGTNKNKTLVVYSLGNFISTQLNSYNMIGAMASFDIVKEQGTDSAHIENPKVIPIMTHYTADKQVFDSQNLAIRQNVQIYQLKDYNETLCANHGSQLWGAFDMSTLWGYVNKVFKSEFLS